jgi:hypothetical protein
MRILPNFVQITVCADSPLELAYWREYWEHILGEFTMTDSIGYGNGSRECAIVITHWTDKPLESLIPDLLPALREYQCKANQFAVFLTVCQGGKLTSYALESSEDYDSLVCEVDRGLKLARYFDQLGGQQ